MNLNDIFSKSVSNVINDEVNRVTSNINAKLEDAVNGLFKKALKKVGIGGKLANALEAEFASSLQNARADKFFGTVTSLSDRAAAADICNAMTPKFAETAFTASERLKGQNGGEGDASFYQFPQQRMAYYTKLEFKQYERPLPFDPPETETKNTIILPLPKDLEEALNIRISQDDAGIGHGIVDALIKVTGGADVSGEQRNLLVQAAAKKLNDLTKGQAGQVAGAIPNPYVTLMFNGVDLRSFTFTWKFSPRNETESMMIRTIIQLIKAAALPTYSTSGVGALQYPLLCKMTLMADDGKWDGGTKKFTEGSHPIIGFKHALIENVTVNHSPNGIPSFFADTSLPTFYQLSITLKEIEYFTAEDYGRSPGSDKYEIFGQIYDKFRDSEIVGPLIKAEEKLIQDVLNPKQTG